LNKEKQKPLLSLDGTKLLHHPERLSKWINQESIIPIYIAFSPSSLCNHKCSFCVYHYKKFEPIFFPFKRYTELVNEWSVLGVKSLFLAGDGEPLLHKNISEMIEHTKKSGIDVAMNTNGVLIDEKRASVIVENLSWIRVSLNAGTPETYAKIHQTQKSDFDLVLKNLSLLVQEKKRLNSDITIGVQTVLLDENAEEIERMALLLKDIGVNYYSVKPFLKHPDTKWTTELENKNKTIERLLELNHLSNSDFTFNIREANFSENFERNYKKCLSSEFMIEVDARGDIYSCGPYIGKEEHRFGNLLDYSFETIWNSKECRERISYVCNKVDVTKCMPFCRPNAINEDQEPANAC
jgi:cyclic pyranopterin phosphate synthase